MFAKPIKKAAKRKGTNAYKLPDPIAAGEILSDMTKKNWILGTSIGVGGFGEIYSAAPYTGKVPKEYPNVIKIEPHGNGPLFVEMHFYMRNAKSDEIDSWQKKKKLSVLGMPRYIGSGSHEYKNTKYRFVVMERYGKDLWKLFEENNRSFPEHTVYKIALQIINVLEYIHHKTYVHADIKGANLLLDLKSQDHVYLVDFGLASHYTTKSDYKLDPKKAHNGTIEYTSRDAHMGVPTMRGDFEILGYNIIQWLAGSLPWEKDLKNTAAVQKQKEKAFEDIQEFLNDCFCGPSPEPIYEYMSLLGNMKFNDTPDYEKYKKILTDGLKQLGHKPDDKLEFKSPTNSQVQVLKSTPQKVKKQVPAKRKSPRTKKVNNPSPVRNNLDESTVEIVMDKKRGGSKDIREILNDIESDEEYDIKIVKKSNLRKQPNVKTMVDQQFSSVNKKKAKVNNFDESNSDSEPEIISKGTKSRPTRMKNTKLTTKSKSQSRRLIIHESATDDDMFDD